MYTINYNGTLVLCDTPEEVKKLVIKEVKTYTEDKPKRKYKKKTKKHSWLPEELRYIEDNLETLDTSEMAKVLAPRHTKASIAQKCSLFRRQKREPEQIIF